MHSMSSTSAFLQAYARFLPLLFIQLLIAYLGARRWPRLRYFFYGLFALVFLYSFAGFPRFGGKMSQPGWMVFAMGLWTYTSTVAFVCYMAVEGIGWTIGRLSRRAPAGSSNAAAPATDKTRRELITTAAYVAAAIPTGILLYGCAIERERFRVEEVTIPFANLPADLEGFRILQLSDVHRSAFLSQEDLTRVVDACRELKPELIIHTGDFISGKGDPLEACIDELARLNNNEPAFGCLGNHEIYAEAENLATLYAARRGITLLRQASTQIRRGNTVINLAGIDYMKRMNSGKYLTGQEGLLLPGTFNVLLSHNPDVFRASAPLGFDLTLSGHTHGGQIRAEILHEDIDVARFYTPYVSGLYRDGTRVCYVTRGIGSIGIPSRVGAPPEITLMKFTRA
jgi:predicted MPP superfamily phosphohydrolase